MSIHGELLVLHFEIYNRILTRKDIHSVVEDGRGDHRKRREDHQYQGNWGRHHIDRLLEIEAEVNDDEGREVQREHYDDAPPLLALKEIASEIDNDRNYRKQEKECSAARSDKVSGYDRIERYFKDNAYVNRKDMSEPAEQETENVYDDAHQIELHERTDACYPVDDHKHSMDQPHYSDRK